MGIADRAWYQRKRFYLPLALLSPVILLLVMVIAFRAWQHVQSSEVLAAGAASPPQSTSTTEHVRMPFAECKRRVRARLSDPAVKIEAENAQGRTYFAMFTTTDARITSYCDADLSASTTIIDPFEE